MTRRIRLIVPIALLGCATLLAGCVVVPARHYYGGPAVYAPGPVVVGGGWGWGWRR